MKIKTLIERLQYISNNYGSEIEIGDIGNEIDFISNNQTICTLFINDDSINCNITGHHIECEDL